MTDIYIASDAASIPEDERLVNEIRVYTSSLVGFKKVIPLFRIANLGANGNADKAFDEVFEKREELIVLEDDVIVGKGFLDYMNNCLEKYRDLPEVYAVSGFLDPRLENIKEHIFLMNRMAPYGIGFWRDKFYALQENRKLSNYKKWFRDKVFFDQYERFSPHSVRALPLIFQGNRFGDFETGIVLEKTGQKVVYPPATLTKSIGFDGSGLHSPRLDFLQNQKLDSDLYIKNYENPKYDHKMSLNYGDLRRRSSDKIINNLIFYLINSRLNYFRLFEMIRKCYKAIKRAWNNLL